MKLIALLIVKFILLNVQVQESDGIIIFCDYAIDTSQEDMPAYMCTSSYMVNYATKALTSVTGEHAEGRTNADVDGLALVEETDTAVLDYIPENIMEIFPKLTMLTIQMTKIHRISAENLRQFPTLKVFDSTFNPITSLPGDLFKYNPDLRLVNFHGSLSATPSQDDSLIGIGENIFGGLEQLTEVYFVKHFCIPTNMAATTRAEVLDLNQRLPNMCPYANVPTDAPTTEGQTSTSTSQTSTSTGSSSVSTEQQTSTTPEQNSSPPSEATATSTVTTERTTTSGQNSLVNESQMMKIFLSFIISVILLSNC